MTASLFFEVDPEAARASLADVLSGEPWYAGVDLEPLRYTRGDGKGAPGLTHVLVVRATDPDAARRALTWMVAVKFLEFRYSYPNPTNGYPMLVRGAGAEGTPAQVACEPEEEPGRRRSPFRGRRPYRGVEE